MRRAARSRWILVGMIPILMMNAAVAAPGDAPTDADLEIVATTSHPFSEPAPRVASERVPLIEMFTATWCSVCAEAERALERILEEEHAGPAPATLAYHPVPDGEDPFGFPEGHERMVEGKYGAVGFPTIWIDGKWEIEDSTGGSTVDVGIEEMYYQTISRTLRDARDDPAAYALKTDWSEEDGEIVVRLDLNVVEALAGPFDVRLALWEDHLRFGGSNGIDDHRMTARALYAAQNVPFLFKGNNWTAEWAFSLPPGVDLEQSGFTVFVERRPVEPASGGPDEIMGYAFGVAATSAVAIFVLRRKNNAPRQKDTKEGPGGEQG